METQNQELKAQYEQLEKRVARVEAENKQLAELLSSLAQVTQQMMGANTVILDLAQKLQKK